MPVNELEALFTELIRRSAGILLVEQARFRIVASIALAFVNVRFEGCEVRAAGAWVLDNAEVSVEVRGDSI